MSDELDEQVEESNIEETIAQLEAKLRAAKRKNRAQQAKEGKYHIDTVVNRHLNDYIKWRMANHSNLRSKNASVRGCVETTETLEMGYPPNCIIYIIEPGGEPDPDHPGQRRDKVWLKVPHYAFFK